MPEILINDIRPRVQVVQGAGPAAVNSFDFGFPVLDEADLKVAVDTALLSPAEYSVTGVGNASGGTVTIASTPAEGARITIWRDMPFQRTTDFTPGADLRAAVLNDELDRTALLLQQAEALAGDSIHRRPYDADVDLILPPVEERAGMLLSFDAEGRPETVNAKISGNLSSFALVYLGTAPTVSRPVARMDGSALQAGDFYFDTDYKSLMAYTGSEWAEAFVGEDTYLPRTGSKAMTGALDMGANAIVNVGTVDGRDVGADGAVLDSLNQGVSALSDVSTLAILNAWEIARLDGLGPQGLVNTYLDGFADETGIDAGSSSNHTLDADGDYVTNLFTPAVVSDAGFDATVFDGAGALNGWTVAEGNTGDVNENAGTVDGRTCVSFTAATPQANCHAQLSKDLGNWGTESLITAVIRLQDIASLGAVSDGGGVAYPAFEITATHDAGRRSKIAIDGNGRLLKVRGGGINSYHFLTDAGTFADDVWYTLTVWQRLDSNNNISDITVWLDGVPVVEQTGQDYQTDVAGSDGDVNLSLSAENGTGGTFVYIHSIDGGRFPVTDGDTRFNRPWVSGQFATMTGGGAVGDDAQAFQVSDTRDIVGGGLALYDGTGLGTANQVTFAIYADNGGAPDIAGGALAACTEDISRELNSAPASHRFTFDTPFTPLAGTTYWLVVDAAASIRVEMDPGGGYADGQARWGGSTQAGADLCFWIRQDRAVGRDMTLVSGAVTASADPAELRGLIDLEAIDTAEENTDFTASVSRDGGTSWSVLQLGPVSASGLSRRVYAGTAAVDGQPSGTACVLKVETSNERTVRLHRWALQADQPLSIQ